MTDAKIVVNQVQEIQLILYDIYKEEMVLSEPLYVIVIIKMLILYWNNFKNYFKYKQKEMGVEISF